MDAWRLLTITDERVRGPPDAWPRGWGPGMNQVLLMVLVAALQRLQLLQQINEATERQVGEALKLAHNFHGLVEQWRESYARLEAEHNALRVRYELP